MAWTRTLLRDHVYRILGRAPGEAANDDQAPVALVNLALDEGYRRFAHDTHCFTRAHPFTAAAGQGTYPLPADMFYVPDDGVTNEQIALEFVPEAEMAGAGRGWRTDTGEPRYWYFTGGRNLGLYPIPTAEASVTARGHVIPYTIGGGNVSVAHADGTATVTTAHAHELAVGDAVVFSGVDPADFYGTATVTGTPSATTFTYALETTEASGAGGLVYYAGGLPTFTGDADIPRGIPASYQLAPAYYAAAWIAGEYFLDDRATAERAALALAKYRALVDGFNGEQLAMMM